MFFSAQEVNSLLQQRHAMQARDDVLDDVEDHIDNIILLYMDALRQPSDDKGRRLLSSLATLQEKTQSLQDIPKVELQSINHNLAMANQHLILLGSEPDDQKREKLNNSFSYLSEALLLLKNNDNKLDSDIVAVRGRIKSLIEVNPFAPLGILWFCVVLIALLGLYIVADIFRPLHRLTKHLIAASEDTDNVLSFVIPNPRPDEIGEAQKALNALFTHMIKNMSERENLQKLFSQSQKMEAVGRLTGGIAHDFNNMMAAVSGNLELLGDCIDEKSEAGVFLRGAQRAVDRGAELTQRLLSFSRKQVLMPKVINLNIFIPQALMLIHRALGEQVEVVLDLAEDPWNISIDPGQLENTLLNLSINSRDAMPDGGVITIQTENVILEGTEITPGLVAKPGPYVVVRIADTGQGIPQSIINKVFEPFFTTKETGKGTGLGLSMVYGFVKQSGGYITIDSRKGIGTSVSLFFPRYDAEAELESVTPGATPASSKLPRGTETILMAEDNEEVLHVNEMILKRLGYHVYCARSGPEALEVLQKMDKIDMLITDMVMPGGMGGRELAQKVREQFPQTKVIFLSGYTTDFFAEKELADMNSMFFFKPLTQRKLAEGIRLLLG